MTRKQEKEGEEIVNDVFWQNKLGLQIVRTRRESEIYLTKLNVER